MDAEAPADERKGDVCKPDDQACDVKTIKVPFLGEINTANLSLPALTVILGSLDGFNPCAMWVLIFLITLLFAIEDKRKRWLFGLTFIIASAFVYFIFMAAWLNLILFIGFVFWVRVLIGGLALGVGTFSIRDYIQKRNVVCKTNDRKKEKIINWMQKVLQKKSVLLALGGLILLAFAVNLIELFCSAGLPAVFTQVLALNHLSSAQHYLYILLYIFFFMLDDIIIFSIAMITLELTGVSNKYAKYSSLVGGLILLIIGLLLIFKPQWLLFG